MLGLGVVLAVLAVQGPPPQTAKIVAAQIDAAPHLTIAPLPVWRIGGDGDGPYSFTAAVGVPFTRDGGAAILEGNPPEVRLFDRAGKHRTSFGRRGRGPGEFEMPQRLVPHTGDSLVVAQIARVSVFDGQGKHARTMNTANASGLSWVHRLLRDGSMLARLTPIPTARQRPEGIVRDSALIALISAHGDTVVRRFGYRKGSGTLIARHGGAMSMVGAPLSPGSFIEGADSLVLSLDGESARLLVLSAESGNTVRSVNVEVPQRRVTEQDREAYESQLRRSTRDPERLAAFLRVVRYPESMPRADALRWSFDSVVRMRRFKAQRDSTQQWLSLTINGRLLSVIDLP
ncbi:MAG: hypothetical protein AB1762_06505, partial [Gemmatimonadota bacterium]